MSNFEKAKVILEMLRNFEQQQHRGVTRALIEAGEGRRCKPLDRIKVSGIKDYANELILKSEK